MESNEYFRVKARIDLDAIEHNVKNIIKNLPENVKICAVVKADGYGHGMIEVANLLHDYVDYYAVATLEEGLEIRKNGISDKEILVLGYVPGCKAKLAAMNNISFTLFDVDNARECSENLGKELKLSAHIKVDTGMGRIGLTPDDEGLEVVKEMMNFENIEFTGIFSHFARADMADEAEYTKLQLEKFLNFCDRVDLVKKVPLRHISNSAGATRFKEAALSMVRLGKIMYGPLMSDEEEKKFELKPALSLLSMVSYVKTIPSKTPISYGGTFVSDKEMKVATVPVGYGDGYKWALSGKGYVLINGKKAHILGRVCMDQFMVDVSDIENVKRYDIVTLIGKDGNEEITADEIGEMTESFGYEILCNVGKRIPREYRRNV